MKDCMNQLKRSTALIWWFTNEYYYDTNNFYYNITANNGLNGKWGFKIKDESY